MTDSEIIRALEICTVTNDPHVCRECPLLHNPDCSTALKSAGLDLINRQKAEIEQLQNSKCLYSFDGETLEYCVQAPCPNYQPEHQTKVETIEEFAERICKGRVSNDPVVIAVNVELEMMEENENDR